MASIKYFGTLELETDRDNFDTEEIPVLIELSEEHVEEIKKVIDFVNQTPSVTKVSIDLCFSLPQPGFTVVSTDKGFKKECEQYTYMYAQVFRECIGLGVTYVTGTNELTCEENYFSYMDTDFFLRETEKGFVVFGGYVADRLQEDEDFVKAILVCLGKDMLEKIASTEQLSMKDVLISES